MNANIKGLQEIAERFMKFGKQTPAAPAPVSTPENFEAAKIKGSETQVEYDPTLAVGSLVMQSSGTGSIAAPDGKYELDNGIIFNVKDGKIETVEANPAATPPATPPAPTTPPAPANFEEAIKVAIDALRTEFTEQLKPLSEAYEAVKPTLETLPTSAQLEAFTEHLQSVGNVIDELSKIPMETEITKTEGATADEKRNEMFNAVATAFTKQ